MIRVRSLVLFRAAASATALAVSACSLQRWQPAKASSLADDHAAHMQMSAPTGSALGLGSTLASTQGIPGIPAGGTDAAARLQASPRKGQFVAIPYEPGSRDSLMVWVTLPTSTAKASVVVVIHDNQGLSTWARAVGDQLAADGFIAIVPDLLSRVRGGASSVELSRDSVGKLLGSLTRPDRQLGILAAATYGMSLPTADKRYGVVGFCWGGGESFYHTIYSNKLGAAVVYYGTPPTKDSLVKVGAPILGLYGGTDARIGATVPGTDSVMKDLKKFYEPHTFDGAGHGFLRSQDNPANVEASKQAWPLTVAFLRKQLAAK